MKRNKKELVFYKVLFAILLIAIISTVVLIVKKYGTQEIYEEKNHEIVELFEQSKQKNDENALAEEANENILSDLEFEGYKVIGLINIPAINLKYPILEKTTQETMKISISKYWGGDINSLGNVSLAGHNNKITLTMFGKNKNLKNGDRVFLTDLTGNTIEYEIYDKFITDPDDITILQTKDNTIREVTLITCTNGRENRLIIKAKEVK